MHGVLDEALVVAELEHALIDRRDTGEPRCHHDTRSRVEDLVAPRRATCAEIGREVVRSEVCAAR